MPGTGRSTARCGPPTATETPQQQQQQQKTNTQKNEKTARHQTTKLTKLFEKRTGNGRGKCSNSSSGGSRT